LRSKLEERRREREWRERVFGKEKKTAAEEKNVEEMDVEKDAEKPEEGEACEI